MEAVDAWLKGHPLAAYLVIFVLTGIIYKVAFARKLPVLKSLIVYAVLAVGCVLFWLMFLLRFPIMEILLVTNAMIIIARIRMAMIRRSPSSSRTENK
ncbi:hypothetical protein GCM10011571_26130 [Marinithermofilum abyssi]|uniref:YlaH-like protein n=1 Tax=Marinithermofilum abyssi TaxID=1571185 RepID=A0A8J2VJ54_9BACL|nr:YlaH-like family protein [Marinithermofilum abyssi]GGE22835.1 hypothetical protein GCM10011571_26130 [Marinithermofilum abyssi]